MFRWLNLAKRVSELEDMMLTLAKQMDSHDMDWHDLRARCKRLMDRTEKAAKRVVESEQAETQEGAVPIDGDAATPHGLLSPKQRLIQQQILRRRAGL